MAAPAIVTCTKDAWVKVATNVTSCRIWKRKQTAFYRMTYVLTGVAAPTDLSDAVNILNGAGNDYYDFTAAAAADVYIYASNKAGSVRVDT